MQKLTAQKLTAPTFLTTSKAFRLIPLLTLLVGLLFVFKPTVALAQEGPPIEEPTAHLFAQDSDPIPPFMPGVVLVGVRGDVASSASTAMTWGDIEVLGLEPLDVRTGEVSTSSAAEALTGYKLTVPVGTEWGAIEVLSARGDVAFAEPDWFARIAQIEPDKAVAETPYAIGDTLYHEQWYAQRIGLSRAWSLALNESEGNLTTVDVFVIDTGADFSHPDLAGRLTAGHNYLDSDESPHDDNGHGTHIAGTIAAAANGSGIVGTGLQVRITPFKVLNNRGVGIVTPIGQAIRDATDQGADIINMSLELSQDTFALRSAVQYAVSKGVLVLAASGNQGKTTVSYPAAYPSVIAVGASTYFDGRAYYSNRGVDLDMMAPGGSSGHSILSTWTSDVGAVCPAGLQQMNGGLYCEADGTSMATGVASGVAALIMSVRPDLDADEVQQILLDSAFPMTGSSDEVGHGRLDAAYAVRLAMEPRLVYLEETAMVSAVQGGASFTVMLPLTNPSLEPLTVATAPTITTTWYTLVGTRAGQVYYGKPLELQLLFTPTVATTGTLSSSIRVTTTETGGSTTVYVIATQLDVYPNRVGAARFFIPWVGAGQGGYRWAEPTFTARTNRAIDGDGSIVVDLPFTMTVNGRAYGDLRIYADGFVVASASALPDNLPNVCLDNQVFPSFSAYGWWSDLSLDVDSQLSTFQPDGDHFAIEYSKFVSLGSSDPDDRVTMQIVLSRNGSVELNYRHVPQNAPANLTVGASVDDGRFYNQVTCFVAGTRRLGEVPQANQSFTLNQEALY